MHLHDFAALSQKVTHLRCLLNFIKTEPDLQRLSELRERIEAGSLEKIRFEDLWMLFRPGDLVVSRKRDHWHLHKVFSTTGGQIQRSTRERQNDYERISERARMGQHNVDEEDEGERFMRESSYGIGSRTPLKVGCYHLEVLYGKVEIVSELWKVQEYLGDMIITELDIYPVRFHPDSADLLKRMEERGLKYIWSPGHKSYKGLSVSLEATPSVPQEIDGDVYIDFSLNFLPERRMALHELAAPSRVAATPRQGLPQSVRAEMTESLEFISSREYLRFLKGNEVDVRLHEEYISSNRSRLIKITVDEVKLSADYLRLLPWAVTAYVFRLRDWCEYNILNRKNVVPRSSLSILDWHGLTICSDSLDVELLNKIDQRPEARDLSFNELVIPDKIRNLLVSLVEDHASKINARHDPKSTTNTDNSRRPQIDLVRGKGQGLIILLHGPPGSGKTSTAETIAAYTQRPLYSLTCGDLGLTADRVERNLSEHTERAARWGCVLLLDEADVFLMQRGWQDMERNALVSGENIEALSQEIHANYY